MLSITHLLDACSDAVVTSDANGVITGWNLAAEDLFGWTFQQAVGKAQEELFVLAESNSDFQQALTIAADDSGQPAVHRIMVNTEAGEQKLVDAWFQLHSSSEGDIHVAFFREVTASSLESRAARLDIQSQLFHEPDRSGGEEETFENALQGALDTLCEVTSWPIGHAFLAGEDDGTIVSANVWSVSVPADCMPFKVVRETTVLANGTDFAETVWQSGQPAWRLIVDDSGSSDYRQLPSGIVAQYCLPVKTDQRVISVLEFFSRSSKPPQKGVENLIKRLSHTLGHIIERTEWQEERQKLAAIVESSYDAIIGQDTSGTITSWNLGAEKLYGYKAEEMIGQTTQVLLPPNMDEEAAKIQNAVSTGQRLEQFETRRCKSNGDIVNVSLTVSPLKNQAGKTIGSAHIERDVTRRKRNQLRLQEAIVTAEQANLAKSEFLANISHELRTPMNAILGMTDLSLQEELPELVRDYLATAKDSADTMLFLINDILDFSRLEAGRFELDPAPFDVRRMLEETMRTLSLRAHEKGLELIGCVDPDVPFRVVGDRMRLRQVLTNLVGNAIKFTEAGEVVVSIDVIEDDIDESVEEWVAGQPVVLKFQVTDTGIGISLPDQERIFSPFTQADASSTRTYAGTGLGLSICVELSRLMDGDLTVESESGSGSQFSFTAGLEVALVSEGEIQQAPAELVELKDAKVLVVDDNDTTRSILKEMLSAWSIDATTVPNAESAVSELQTANAQGEEYTVMLVDAVMPQTDGIQLIQQIDNSDYQTASTILMLSSADQRLFRGRAEHLAVDAFLEKPVSQSSLLNALGDAVGANFAVQSDNVTIPHVSRGLRILVADDIAANQKVVSAILRKRGHDVVIAHNGREAIDRYQNETMDVILMDVQMPIMDGLQATAAIRELEESTGQHIPIIAMTAHALRGDREACMDIGMDAYLSKPLDANQLIKTIERLAAPASTIMASEQFKTETSAATDKPPEQKQLDVWNPKIAMGRMGDDTELLKNMIGYFFEDVPDLLSQLESALSSGSTEEATRLAHSLKGLCANFESPLATSLAEQCESLCRRNKAATAIVLLPQLKDAVDVLSLSLENWKQST